MMDRQKNMTALKEGQTIWRADEGEWQQRLDLPIIVDGKFQDGNFLKKYPNLFQLNDTCDLFAIVGAWNEVGRSAVNAYRNLHENLNKWLYDPSCVTDIDFMVTMLRDMKVLSEHIESNLLNLKESRGC